MNRRSSMLLSSAALLLASLPAPATAQVAGPPAPAATPAPAGPTSGMIGVPTIDLGGGFTVKPRGRLHLDYGDLSGPVGSGTRTEGLPVEMRRLRFGVEGDLPGEFTYRFDADFTGNVVEVVDAWVRFKTGPATITAGQQNIAQSLEELTSSNDVSFMERAAFTDAFGFSRRVGVQAEYAQGSVLVQAGVSRENLLELNDGAPNAWGLNGRAVFAPRLGTTQLHLGVHGSTRDFGDAGRSIRYRQRAFLRSVNTRFVATPSLLADSERAWGVEGAVQHGRFHGQVEAHWQQVNRPVALTDPTFFGMAIEGGVFLTNDQRNYRGGVFRGPTVRRPITTGGTGAIQLNGRYDRLDLNDGGIIGGTQDSYQASLIWWPVPQVRLMLNYARLDYRDAAVAIAGSRNYRVDAVGTRFQIAF
jgi:phosphate-selective porin OprO and OprP